MTARNQLQKAIYAKLTGDTTLMALITGIFDMGNVPENQVFPYITLGNTTETDDSVLARIGYDDTLTLHIWTSNITGPKGSQQSNTILSNLNRLLNHQSLTLDTQNHVGTWYDFSDFLADPGENGVFHMPVRYRMRAQE